MSRFRFYALVAAMTTSALLFFVGPMVAHLPTIFVLMVLAEWLGRDPVLAVPLAFLIDGLLIWAVALIIDARTKGGVRREMGIR